MKPIPQRDLDNAYLGPGSNHHLRFDSERQRAEGKRTKSILDALDALHASNNPGPRPMYRIAIGPEQQPVTLKVPTSVLVSRLSDTYATRDEAQDALDAFAEEIEDNNPDVYASPGLYALEIDDCACFHIEEV